MKGVVLSPKLWILAGVGCLASLEKFILLVELAQDLIQLEFHILNGVDLEEVAKITACEQHFNDAPDGLAPAWVYLVKTLDNLEQIGNSEKILAVIGSL